MQKWTKELITKEALKYTTRSIFRAKAAGAVKAAQRFKIYDDVCAHMKLAPKSKWTFEEIHAEALKFKTRSTFQSKSGGAYTAAYKQGIMHKVTQHMESKLTHLTAIEVKNIASKYTTVNDFRLKEPKAYSAALRKEIKNEVCAHMEGVSTFWTNAQLIVEVNKYTTRTAFRTDNPGAYNCARRKGIWDEISKHLNKKAFLHYKFSIPNNLTGLYFLYDENEIVYIGKSKTCINSRVRTHTTNKEFNKVEIYQITTQADMDVAELYLISLHNPKYNLDGKSHSKLTLTIDNLDNVIISTTTYTIKDTNAESK